MEPISVVIPTRNRLATLRQALDAVLAQRDVDLRVVIVDEASSDGTEPFLAGLTDDRITVVRNDIPRGLGGARNCGVAKSATSLVAFCDDDDLWAPDKLASQLAAMAAHPQARWACTGNVSVDADLRIAGHHRPTESGDIFDRLRAINVVPAGGSSVLVERDLLDEVGGFDETMARCEDYDLWCRLGRAAHVATVDRPLVAYRVWPGSLSTDIEGMRGGHAKVIERYRGDIDPEVARSADLRHEMYLGRFYLRDRDRLGAFRHYLTTAVKLREPRQALHGALGLVAPERASKRRDDHERAQVPADWAAQADAWLKVLRQ